MRAILLTTLLLLASAASPAGAADAWRQTGETVYKGHRLTTLIDDAGHRGKLKLDDREIALPSPVSEVGKITLADAQSTILFAIAIRLVAGNCGSFVLVSVPATETGKGDTLFDFGPCNGRLNLTLRRVRTWAAWYAIGFRDDLAAAKVAMMRNAAMSVHDVTAPPCLFADKVPTGCVEPLIAAAYGSQERGLLTGEASFGERRIETFFNRASGKATILLDGKTVRTFDGAADFNIDQVNAGESGMFALWLKPAAQGCSVRPLVFLPDRTSEPQVIADFAPCTDRLLGAATSNKPSEWTGIAFRLGDTRGFVASVADHKLTTRTAELPACLVTRDGAKSPDCLRQLVPGGAPPSGTAPKPRIAPTPAKPRTIPL